MAVIFEEANGVIVSYNNQEYFIPTFAYNLLNKSWDEICSEYFVEPLS